MSAEHLPEDIIDDDIANTADGILRELLSPLAAIVTTLHIDLNDARCGWVEKEASQAVTAVLAKIVQVRLDPTCKEWIFSTMSSQY